MTTILMVTLYFALRIFENKHNLNAKTTGESQLRDGSWYSGSVKTETRQGFGKDIQRLKAFSTWFLLLNYSWRFGKYCLISNEIM